jgi:hypothetical protein
MPEMASLSTTRPSRDGPEPSWIDAFGFVCPPWSLDRVAVHTSRDLNQAFKHTVGLVGVTWITLRENASGETPRACLVCLVSAGRKKGSVCTPLRIPPAAMRCRAVLSAFPVG